MLRRRIVTALALALLLVAVILYSSPDVTALVLGLFVLIGAWEWSAFLAAPAVVRGLYVLVLGAVGLTAALNPLDTRGFAALMLLVTVWWLGALAWIVLAPQRVSRAAAALAGLMALLPSWLALVRIDARWPRGAQWTLFILALVFAADTGAFFAGHLFGRIKLAARVSPNKTWEGVCGGMLFALGVAWVGAAWFNLAAGSFVPLCLGAALFSIVGDLTESLLKRHVHLKDSGHLIPGHGGVLDRLDSITAATPVMALGLLWLGVGS